MVRHVTIEAERLNILMPVVSDIAVYVMRVQSRPCATNLATVFPQLFRSPSMPRFRNSFLRIRTGKRAVFPILKCRQIFQPPIVPLPKKSLPASLAVFLWLLFSLHYSALQFRPTSGKSHHGFYPRRVQLATIPSRHAPAFLCGYYPA